MTNDRFASRMIADRTVDRAPVFPVSADVSGVPAPGLLGVLDALHRAAVGAVRDRMSGFRLSRMSDHVLADMGLNRYTLAADLATARTAAAARRGALVSQRLAAWREQNRIYRELSNYTEAELAEIGMARRDIRAAARGQAVLLFRDAGLVDGHFATEGHPVTANWAVRRRAA